MKLLDASLHTFAALLALRDLSGAAQRHWREKITSWGPTAPAHIVGAVKEARVLPYNGSFFTGVTPETSDTPPTPTAVDETVIPVWSQWYPEMLRQIPDYPLFISVRGDFRCLSVTTPRVAIVGTRTPSQEASIIAAQLAVELADRQALLVSGLALGIDGIVHRSALGRGRSVAVLGGGLKRIYPARHEDLARILCEDGGVLITEYLPHEGPRPHQFLERNRIIAALSHVVVVVEAPERSGSLNTARWAVTQGKEVAAVPDTPLKKNALGNLALIREGAYVVRNAADIWDLLPSWVAPSTSFAKDAVGRNESQLLATFSAQSHRLLGVLEIEGKVGWDTLVGGGEWTNAQLVASVTELEQHGLVTRTDEGEIFMVSRYTGRVTLP